MSRGIVDLPQIKWRPLDLIQPSIVPSQLIVHTAVTTAASLFKWFSGPSGGNESHVFLKEDGSGEQYISAEMRADANGTANRWFDKATQTYRGAFSVETWDKAQPDLVPLSNAQMGTLADIALWLHEFYRLPLVLCTSPTASGIGWHSMWPAPNPWSPAAHSCPGPLRAAQVRDQLLPNIKRKQMRMAATPTFDVVAYVKLAFAAAGNVDQGGQRYWAKSAARAADTFAALDEMDRQLGVK